MNCYLIVIKVMAIGAGALFVLVVLVLAYGRAMTPHVPDDKFLEHLGFDWKTGLQIRDNLNAIYCPKRLWFGTINTADIYIALTRLEEQGFVERRGKVLTQKERDVRGGLGEKEYRRSGTRKPVRSKATNHLQTIET